MLAGWFARRYFFSKKSHSVINLIAGVVVVSVAVPVAAMIVLLSVFNGFEQLVRSMNSHFDADLTLTPREGQTFGIESLDTAALRRLPGVEAVSLALEQSALMEYRGRQAMVTVRGVADGYDRVVPVAECITAGDYAVRLGDPQLGECCVVYGCGVVGLSMIQVLYAKGIRNLIAIAKYPYQAEIAKKCGAAHVVLYKNKEQVVQDVMALTGGNGADQTYECVGGSSGAINDAAAFTTRQGKIVMMGIFAGVPETDLNTLFMKEISLIASNSYGMSGYRDEFAIALEMLAYKQVDHNLLISHRFKPEQYVEAIEAARGKDKSGAVKVLFERD